MDSYSMHTVMKIVPVVVLLGLVVLIVLRHQTARHQRQQGIIWLQAVRTLLTHIQRHRGLSSGFLAGDKSLNGQMEDVQKQVSRDFDHISAVGEWVKSHPGWQSITQHWARLAGNVYSLPTRQAIDQHNRLIKNILVFVDDIATAHHLGSLSGARANIWRELLTLAELVGQARAVGTALCASAPAYGSSEFELAHRDLQEIHNSVLNTLEAPRCRNNLDSSSLQQILNFLAFIDAQLLQQGPVISAKEFYQTATQSLDHLYERFDGELGKVTRRVSG